MEHHEVLPVVCSESAEVVQAANMEGVALPGCRINASNDFEAVREWLDSKRNLSGATIEHCAIAAKKLLWWMNWRGLALARFEFRHIDEFIEFCRQPPSEVMERKRQEGGSERVPIPFKKPLAESSAQQMRVVVSGLFQWLVKARYIDANPLDLVAQPRRKRGGSTLVTRRFSDVEWAWIDRTLAAMPEDSPRAIVHRVRARYLFELLQHTGLRLSEVCNNTMGGFTFLRSGEAQGWFLVVTGKGGKERDIPVPPVVIEVTQAYRRASGLPERIAPGDTTPLIMSVSGNRPIKRRVVARIIEEILRAALENAKIAGVPEAELTGLQEGSTHWLRHTYGSRLGEANAPLTVIRDNLGHASIATSSIYVHSDRLRRHAETLKALQGRDEGQV